MIFTHLSYSSSSQESISFHVQEKFSFFLQTMVVSRGMQKIDPLGNKGGSVFIAGPRSNVLCF